MNTLTILLLSTIGVGLVLLYLTKRNNAQRKENLNIIKEEGKIHFYLSDDHFFSIDLDKGSKLSDAISKTITNEIECIRKSVRKISFINFKNDPLEKELNLIIKVKRG